MKIKWTREIITTNFKNVEECIQNIRDIERKTLLGTSFMSKISGIIDEDGNFELSSTGNGPNNFKFCGKIKKVDEKVILDGEYKMRDFFNFTKPITFFTWYGILLTSEYVKLLFNQNTNLIQWIYPLITSLILVSLAGLIFYLQGRFGYRKLRKHILKKVERS